MCIGHQFGSLWSSESSACRLLQTVVLQIRVKCRCLLDQQFGTIFCHFFLVTVLPCWGAWWQLCCALEYNIVAGCNANIYYHSWCSIYLFFYLAPPLSLSSGHVCLFSTVFPEPSVVSDMRPTLHSYLLNEWRTWMSFTTFNYVGVINLSLTFIG